jgi:glyoxylase-like metal-dependent hydrolase (beta-lactamase superfamily II)/8-oxo-dGTP pyrophosphatase MutT (NUDIX family)
VRTLNPITAAASVLLARGPGSAEVFLVARAPTLRFLGGFHAFPGGKVHVEDETLVNPARGVTVRQVAAVRELFEETGVLLARQPGGAWPRPSPAWNEARQALLEERLSFPTFLRDHQLEIHSGDLLPAGSLVTPPFTPMRFDTAFFVAVCPPGQEPTIWPGELTDGFWADAETALAAWTRGELLLSPPTVSILQLLRGRQPRDLPESSRPLLDQLALGALHPIWFSPGVRMIPLRCLGLPPTTHTNAYLVGTNPLYLFDPGPTDPDEQARLFAILDETLREGRRIEAIVLTHHHPDHVGAAQICSQKYHLPILAHPLTARDLAGKISVDRLLLPGEHLDLGPSPSGQGHWHLEPLHTPGHAAGHLAFYEPTYQLMFAGDMVSTISSIIVAPPGGDLAVYLRSLRSLLDYPIRLLLPSHGGASARAHTTVEEALAHRAKREQQLLEALAERPRTIADLAQELYKGLPPQHLTLAELQLLACLEKVQREGRVVQERTTWRRLT